MSLFSDWVTPFFIFKVSEEDNLRVPSYEEVVDRSWDPPDKDRLVAYLRGCPIVTATTGFDPIVCPICGETLQQPPEGGAQQSDGLWVWFKVLIHYIEFHDVRLPDKLVERIRANEYRPPVCFDAIEDRTKPQTTDDARIATFNRCGRIAGSFDFQGG